MPKQASGSKRHASGESKSPSFEWMNDAGKTAWRWGSGKSMSPWFGSYDECLSNYTGGMTPSKQN